MSIKVMTWVWDHSPTSGTELLLLLAIADQANDSGADAWPSVADLARRTRLAERTVQRLIQKLAAAGHLVVTNGGGRLRNRYAIRMEKATDNGHGPSTNPSTPPPNCHPRQTDTGDMATDHPRHSYDTPGVAQLRHPTPDTAASPVPSCPVLIPSTSRAHEHERAGEQTPDGGGGIDPRVVEILTSLGPKWTITPRQRKRLAPKVADALDAGWPVRALVEHLAANPEGVKSPAAVLAARLDDLGPPKNQPEIAARRPEWCGECHEATRQRENASGVPYRCPVCHPLRAGPASPDENGSERPKPPSNHRSEPVTAPTTHESRRSPTSVPHGA